MRSGGPLARLFARVAAGAIGALGDGGRERLARSLASLVYGLRVRRRITDGNLREAFPERSLPERRALAREAYAASALAFLEGVAAPTLSDRALEERFRFENWEALEEARREGKGVLLACAHLGPWELLGEALARRGLPLHVVVRPLKGALNAELVKARLSSGMKLIYPRGAIRGSLKALRRGEVVAMVVDQAASPSTAAFVPFFGRLAATSLGLAATAQRSGAPVFVLTATRDPEGIRAVFEGPIHLQGSGVARRELEEFTADITARLEARIRDRPGQWLWLHRRWKHEPPPSPSSKGRGAGTPPPA